MLGVDNNVALDCQKSGVIAQAALGQGSSVNTTSTSIALFGHGIRQKIQSDAQGCNTTSSALFLSSPKEEQDRIANLCNGVNKYVDKLQDTLAWTSKSGNELMELQGLDDAAKSTLSSTLSETLNYGAETISNALNNVSEAMTRLSSAASQAPAPVQSKVSTTQETIANTSEKLAEGNLTTADDKFVSDENVATKKDLEKVDIEVPELNKDTEKVETKKPDINKDIDFGKTFKLDDKAKVDMNNINQNVDIALNKMPVRDDGGK